MKLSETMTEMFFLPDDWKRWEKGIFKKMDKKVKEQAGDLPLIITEWNSMAVFGSPVHDEKYSAAFAVKTCLDLDGSAEGYMFWCCSDLFEEQFMLPRPFVGSFGVVSPDGIPKPNFWGFKMLSQLYPNRLELADTGDIDCGAFTDGKNIQLIITPQNGDYCKNEQTALDVIFDFEAADVTIQKIDDDNCNPKRIWNEMGAPDNLTKSQVAEIKEKSRLREEKMPYAVSNGKTGVKLSLCTNDVVLITARSK